MTESDKTARLIRALERVLLDVQSMVEDGLIPNVLNDATYVEAQAALAALSPPEALPAVSYASQHCS
jgi:hypothetical protein